MWPFHNVLFTRKPLIRLRVWCTAVRNSSWVLLYFSFVTVCVDRWDQATPLRLPRLLAQGLATTRTAKPQTVITDKMHTERMTSRGVTGHAECKRRALRTPTLPSTATVGCTAARWAPCRLLGHGLVAAVAVMRLLKGNPTLHTTAIRKVHTLLDGCADTCDAANIAFTVPTHGPRHLHHPPSNVGHCSAVPCL